MGQITREFAEVMVSEAKAGRHTGLTAWEQQQLAQAWLDREAMRADATRLDWIILQWVAPPWTPFWYSGTQDYLAKARLALDKTIEGEEKAP